MTNFNKEDLYNRGWTDDKIKHLLNIPYLYQKNQNNQPLWESSTVERLEKTISYINFVSGEKYLKTLDFIDKDMKVKTECGISYVNSLNIKYENPSNLLSNLSSYDNLSHIVHLPNKSFKADNKKNYTLFTDGCFKNIGREAFSTCGGWILENETQTVVAEFSKTIPLNDKKTRSMPEFELIGIYEGVKLIKKLGLKNVKCYTDSVGEANIIYSALNGIGEKRIQLNSEMYDSIIDTLTQSNSTIGWIPRDYNSHADKLTKIPLNIWLDNYKKEYIEKDYFQENGYLVNKDIDIFFPPIKNNLEVDAGITMVNVRGTQHNARTVVNLLCLHNNTDGSLDLLHQQSKEDFNEVKIVDNKKISVSGSIVMNFVKGLTILQDCPNLTIEVSSSMYAIMKNLAPISNSLQEEYFALHKAIKDFSGNLKIKKMPLERLHELSKMVGDEGFGIRKKQRNSI